MKKKKIFSWRECTAIPRSKFWKNLGKYGRVDRSVGAHINEPFAGNTEQPNVLFYSLDGV